MSWGAALIGCAARAAHRALAAPMRQPKNWRLEGSFRLSPLDKNRWRATLEPADPLRLRHVPTGRCLCPAFRETVTDLASVPWFLQAATRGSKALHLQADSFPKSALFHDSLYTAAFCWAVEKGLAQRAGVTRAQADALLFLCLFCEGATGYDAVAWFNGVRLGGERHWKAARREEAKWPPLFGGSAVAAREIVPDRFPEVRDGQKSADEPGHRTHHQPRGQAKPGPVFSVQQEPGSAKHGQQQ